MPDAHLEMRQWRMLLSRALEASAPAAPAFLQAALWHLPAAQRPHLHVVKDDAGRLSCVAPLLHERWRWPPLGRIATSRWGDFFFLGLPLVDGERSESALRELLYSVRHAGMAALELRAVPASGPVMQALRATLAKTGQQPLPLACWQRAVLDADRAPEEWWRQDIRSKRRKEWTRLKHRLGERGELRFESLPQDASIEVLREWMEDFLQLEAAGWKGRNGTALLCADHNAAFARAMMRGFHATGDLRFWRLRLDGRTIAALFGMVVRNVLWLGKIAYDEDERLRGFSPGVLLTIEATRDILADQAITFADSSADPDHPMIDHLWKQRLELVDVLVPLPGISSRHLAMLGAMERAYRHVRHIAKLCRQRLRQRK